MTGFRDWAGKMGEEISSTEWDQPEITSMKTIIYFLSWIGVWLLRVLILGIGGVSSWYFVQAGINRSDSFLYIMASFIVVVAIVLAILCSPMRMLGDRYELGEQRTNSNKEV